MLVPRPWEGVLQRWREPAQRFLKDRCGGETMEKYQMFIGGRWVNAVSEETTQVTDPSTEEGIATVPRAGAEDVNRAAAAAKDGFEAWSRTTPSARASYLWKIADLLGVVASIAPWNYPFMMAVWKIGPALAAGNTVVVKPASWTPLSTLEIARAAEEAGLPAGVLNVVTGPGGDVGAALVTHPDVAMVSVTGDTVTGKKIMAAASAGVKRVHLELGGKAPFIVYGDADLDAAIQGAVVGGYVNTGQDCTAATRVYVQRPAYERFVDGFVQATKRIRLGPTASRATDLGPLISSAQRERVEGFVDRARGVRAEVLCGGRRPPRMSRGFYYEPT